ncbi:MAG: hypothetical protein KKB50_08705 [Planctomycetes bacterium]|nr:hypothetical protein [Planctomycetota bacterium]
MRLVNAIAVLAALSLATAAQADLLWDNYQYGDDQYGHDHLTAASSERLTQITDSWAADDAIFDAQEFPLGVRVQQVRWIGMRDPNYSYPAADYIVLSRDAQGVFHEVASGQVVIYDMVEVMGQIDFPGLETYEASVELPDIELDPGQYYFGVRLVGSGSGLGRNYVATTGAGEFLGLTSGAVQSNYFGIPNWTLNSDYQHATDSDYAYQIHGVAIPEPVTMIMLLAGAPLLLRRR